MKKLFIILALVGCQKNNPQPDPEPQLDCNCDRVVEVYSFNILGTMHGHYTTINDCTQIQREHEFTGAGNKPNVGDCK